MALEIFPSNKSIKLIIHVIPILFICWSTKGFSNFISNCPGYARRRTVEVLQPAGDQVVRLPARRVPDASTRGFIVAGTASRFEWRVAGQDNTSLKSPN
jgi:hypothetical protein